MKIYTRRGDRGETSLFSGARVQKDSLRVEAYGTVDELNSWLGLILSQWPKIEGWQEEGDFLLTLQRQLFTIGAELATPPEAAQKRPGILPQDIETLEARIDRLQTDVSPLIRFILPGGTPLAAAIQVARTVARRAERLAVSTAREEEISAEALAYLNRLSDYLFILGRWVNQKAGVDEPTL